MYTKLEVSYADGTIQRFDTEPMRRNSAKELMLSVFYGQSAPSGDDVIVSIGFYPARKGKPLFINREPV